MAEKRGDLLSASDRERLRSIFSVPYEEHKDRWDKLWQDREFLPWDRGFASPALVDLLNDRQELLGAPVDANGKRKLALVPGCGGGYDVLLLASLGYDAYGLDISEHAVQVCNEIAEREFPKYVSEKAPEHGPGTYKFIQGDFFDNKWLEANQLEEGAFDFVYDYTFGCALPPKARPAWALRYSNLLSPRGRMVCLEFPTFKEPNTGGPPWCMRSDVYMAHLTRPGEDVPYDEEGYPADGTDSGKGSPALERIAHWKPERTHPVGQGTDWMSVWQHK